MCCAMFWLVGLCLVSVQQARQGRAPVGNGQKGLTDVLFSIGLSCVDIIWADKQIYI